MNKEIVILLSCALLNQALFGMSKSPDELFNYLNSSLDSQQLPLLSADDNILAFATGTSSTFKDARTNNELWLKGIRSAGKVELTTIQRGTLVALTKHIKAGANFANNPYKNTIDNLGNAFIDNYLTTQQQCITKGQSCDQNFVKVADFYAAKNTQASPQLQQKESKEENIRKVFSGKGAPYLPYLSHGGCVLLGVSIPTAAYIGYRVLFGKK